MNKIFLLLIATAMMIISCNDQAIDDVEPSSKVLEPKLVKSKNGILVFNDQTQLNETLNRLLQMTNNEINEWEKKHNFVSAQTIFENIVTADSEIDAYYESLTEEEQNALDKKTIIKHSDLFYKYLDDEMIVDYEQSDKEDTYRLNLADESYAPICNSRGIFMVGDTLFQIASNKIKYWVNGDVNQTARLINAEEETDEIKFIVRQARLKGSLIENQDYTRTTGYSGSKRKISFETFRFETWKHLGDGTVWQYKYDIKVVSRKKNWLGKWKYNNTDIHIRGNWSGEVKYYDPVYLNSRWLYFNSSWPANYPNWYNVNYSNVRFAVSINSGATGTYDSKWNLSLTNSEEIADISLTSVDWIAYGHEWHAKATVKTK